MFNLPCKSSQVGLGIFSHQNLVFGVNDSNTLTSYNLNTQQFNRLQHPLALNVDIAFADDFMAIIFDELEGSHFIKAVPLISSHNEGIDWNMSAIWQLPNPDPINTVSNVQFCGTDAKVLLYTSHFINTSSASNTNRLLFGDVDAHGKMTYSKYFEFSQQDEELLCSSSQLVRLVYKDSHSWPIEEILYQFSDASFQSQLRVIVVATTPGLPYTSSAPPTSTSTVTNTSAMPTTVTTSNTASSEVNTSTSSGIAIPSTSDPRTSTRQSTSSSTSSMILTAKSMPPNSSARSTIAPVFIDHSRHDMGLWFAVAIGGTASCALLVWYCWYRRHRKLKVAVFDLQPLVFEVLYTCWICVHAH
jgi:hypothetical protein